jgi:K+-transporting ATPase ATPase A chain
MAGLLMFLLFSIILIATTVPLGNYMARLFAGERTFLHPVLRPVERLIYTVCGVDEEEDMPWTRYTIAGLLFSLFTLVMTYAVLRLQGYFPFNPQHLWTMQAPAGATPMTPDLAFNTAMSFTTNTNWQAYTPEVTMSYFSQMVGLATHNFFSAAFGIVFALALVRGFARRSASGIGNFWVDMTRCMLYLLLPMCAVIVLVIVWQGTPQNFSAYTDVKTLQGAAQSIAQGPIASQEAIKMLGTNGGGFVNANSAHPYENPTPFTSFFQCWLIFCIPAGLTYMFGRMVGDVRQGWAVFIAMFVLFAGGLAVISASEHYGNPLLTKLGVDQQASALQSGGNMEGKEVRFGIDSSTMFATITTDASCGAVNCMHDSLTPLGMLVPLLNIQLGEVVFGGVGSGLYGMLIFAIIAVFIAGLMVGRTPEYVGKKIEKKEVKMAMLAVLILCFSILFFTAASTVLQFPKDGYWNAPGAAAANTNNGGPRGFSEMLYAYTSGTGNNGSALAGLSCNTPWYNLTIGLAMFFGRFLMVIPIMGIAGSLAAKKYVPPSAGTFPTHTTLFVVLLVGTVVIVGALTFFPALSLGPIVEHFQMMAGKAY